jgi:sRNA-binding protein
MPTHTRLPAPQGNLCKHQVVALLLRPGCCKQLIKVTCGTRLSDLGGGLSGMLEEAQQEETRQQAAQQPSASMAAAAASAAQQPSASAAAAPTLAAQQPSISAAAAPWPLARGVKDNHASQKMLEHYAGGGCVLGRP